MLGEKPGLVGKPGLGSTVSRGLLMCLILERVTLVIFGANERMVIDLMRCLFHVG